MRFLLKSLSMSFLALAVPAQAFVFPRGDSVVVALAEAVYQTSRTDSVYTPWPGSDRVQDLCGVLQFREAPGGNLFAWGDQGLCLVGPSGTRRLVEFGIGNAKTPERFVFDPAGTVAIRFYSGDWWTSRDTGRTFRSEAPDTSMDLEEYPWKTRDGSVWKLDQGYLRRKLPGGTLDSFPFLTKNNGLLALFVDVSGAVVARDFDGLLLMSKAGGSVISLPKGISGYLERIVQDRNGKIWVTTGNDLLAFREWQLVEVAGNPLPSRLDRAQMRRLTVDSLGEPWVLSSRDDLLHWKGDGWTVHRVNLHKPRDPKVSLWTADWIPDLLEPYVVRIPGVHRRLWVVSGPRILQWEAESLSVVGLPFAVDTNSVMDLSVMALSESDITVQEGTKNQWRWNGIEWKREKPVDTFLGVGVAGSQGDAWMGTWSGWLWKDSVGIWRKVDTSETPGAIRSGVSDALAVPGGDLYFATDSGIVARIGGRWETQMDVKNCRRMERDREGVLYRVCGHQWYLGDGRTWSVPDTASGAMHRALIAPAGDSTVWFYKDGLKVWKKGRVVDFPLLSSSIPPVVRAMKALDDGRVVLVGPRFFAVREPFSLDEVPVKIGAQPARGAIRNGAMAWRRGRLELSGLPTSGEVRVDVFGMDGSVLHRSVVSADGSGRAVLAGVPARGRTLLVRAQPQGFPAWSGNVVCFP